MFQKLKQSIFTRLLGGIIVPITLIFIGLAILILNQVKERITEITTKELAARSEASANGISEFFTKNIEVTKQLAANYELEKLLQKTTPGVRMEKLPNFPDFMQTMKNICALDSDTIAVSWIADVDSSQCLESSGWISEEGKWDITSRSWFQELHSSTDTIVTEPYQNSSTGAYVSSIITPVYNRETKELLGVAAIDISVDHLKSMMDDYQLGNAGFFLLVSKANKVMYHPNSNYIDKDIIDAVLSDNILSAFQASHEGNYVYTSDGIVSHGYLSIAGESGWKVLTGLPNKEFYQSYQFLKFMIITVFSSSLFVLLIFLFFISKGIIRPLKSLKDSANQIASGNLDIQINSIQKDETGQVAEAFQKTVLRLKDYINYIDEISSIIEQIAYGNFDYELTLDYAGEFQKIKYSLEKVSNSLSQTLTEIHKASYLVAGGSNKLTSDSQMLSKEAIKQANSVEELSSTIRAISSQINENAKNAKAASELSANTSKEAKKGHHQIEAMTCAMSEISRTSKSIEKIIHTMEDITFQTNLLALNASIEAARAGTSGKGFAVVADQVSDLASKSSDAAKNITELIKNSIHAVENGTIVVMQTAESLKYIVEGVQKSSVLMDKIASISVNQAAQITQITVGMEQVSSSIEMNASTSQESAAKSEELQEQAKIMQDLVDKFILKSDYRASE